MMMIKMTWLDAAALLSCPVHSAQEDDDKRTVWTNCVFIYILPEQHHREWVD